MRERVAIAIAGALLLACSDGASRWILKRRVGDAGVLDAGALDASAQPPRDADSSDAALAPDAGGRDPLLFASTCSPDVTVDNLTADGNGALFDRAFASPEAALVDIARQVCALLYKAPEEVTPSPPILLVIDDFFGIGEVGITAPVIYIRLSSLHMQSAAAEGKDVRAQIEGDLHYLLAIDYALDNEEPSAVRWVLEGLAAWTRYRAGYASIAERRPGGNPIDDADAAGFFFDWLDRTYPDAVYQLNQSLDPSDGVQWSERVFEQITGEDLSTLWSTYQGTL